MSFLSSVTAAFKGGGASRVPIARHFTSPWFFADGGPNDSGTPPTYEYTRSVRRAWCDNPVAQRAVRLVSESVGGAPLSPVADELASLVTATSAGQSLLETLAAQLLLHGDAYAQILKDADGRPVELFALRPERMTPVAGEDGWPTGYTYRVGEKTVHIALEDESGAPNLVHIRGFSPLDDHHGTGCLSAADAAVALHDAATRWNRALLDNAARPSGALVCDSKDGDTLTAEQFERLKAELAAAYQGMANAGRPMLLEGGLRWQGLALTPAEMDFAELKAGAARDIALAFGVPPMLLGLPGDNTYANYREANRALWRLTLLPLGAKILGALAEGLDPWFHGETLAIDIDRVPELAEDREKLWARVTAADFLSDGEKRRLLGLETDDDA
ncbi:phage portal protein [Pseudoblastomonas halimionae]|uniref:Phage portal protein n=1 Tax=Alteriqipengyuania halimionae TaxID=1926630 RepID=A0A6I4U4Y3_9SPHN|nr:phage portal protein [Alteriqipengyuania halimionae]MXP11028.1 phage portal protein [Alteriqipengyuania halimionae]